jgi:hypothetical protein
LAREAINDDRELKAKDKREIVAYLEAILISITRLIKGN